MHVLVVEGDQVQSGVTRSILEKRGIKVESSATLEGTLKILPEGAFDAILLNLFLPDSIGLDTFRSLHRISPTTPIIVHALKSDQKLAETAVQMGAHDLILRDTAAEDEIVRCLTYAIERNDLRRDLWNERKRLKSFLDNTQDAFVSMDGDGKITGWNPQAEAIFGWTKKAALGCDFKIMLAPHLRKQYSRLIDEEFIRSKETTPRLSTELSGVHKNGHAVPIQVVFFKIQGDTSYKNCAFIRDMNAIKRSQEELERLVIERTEKLTLSNEELQQFAKVASHDLQEPVRAVQGFADLLLQRSKTSLDKDSLEFVEFIKDSADRMQQLIQSVLAHSQINGKDSYLHVTSCNAVIEEVIADLKTVIDESQVVFEVGRLPDVAVAHTQMVQLFQNLIGNAIKYRGDQALTIVIDAEEAGEQWLFSVSDTSIGIDAKYADKIFDMFARLHGKTQYPGTGIGLAICKRIVTSHGGKIWVESKPGEGSVFLFTLPTITKSRRNSMNELIRILLVEDTPSDVRLTQEALKASPLKYELTVANDGVEAIDLLRQLRDAADKDLPHVILLDLNMPRKNGHEVLEDIKSDPLLKRIPVILLTVSERNEDVLEALRLKMNYYIAKPVSSQKLTALIKSIHEVNGEQVNADAPHTTEEAHIRLVLAGNPHTAPVALSRLAEDPMQKIRCRVAENVHTPVEILEKLATDPDAEVRSSVSENLNLPPWMLEKLSQDASENVRLSISTNPRTPKHLLERLQNDQNAHVSQRARETLNA